MKGIHKLRHGIFSLGDVDFCSVRSTNFGCRINTQFQINLEHLISTCILLLTATKSKPKIYLHIWKLGVDLTPILEFWLALEASDRTRFTETYSWVEIGCQIDTLFGFTKSSKFGIPSKFWNSIGANSRPFIYKQFTSHLLPFLKKNINTVLK